MPDTQYTNCFVLDAGYNEKYAIYNLNGKYTTLEFDMGHIDAKVEGLPVHYTIQLDGAKQMKINSCTAPNCADSKKNTFMEEK